MLEREYLEHLVRAIQRMYDNTYIKIVYDDSRVEVNEGMRQGCALSSLLFNIHIDDVIKQWHNKILKSYEIDDVILDTFLFANDQILLAETEDDLQDEYNLKISASKTKIVAFKGREKLFSMIKS